MRRDNWVRSLGLDADGTLFVEIDNGIRLYDLCLNHRLPAAVNVPPQDLMKVENRQLYYSFLATLKEIESIQFHHMYAGNHQFKRGDVVVDAGARIGTFAAQISAAVGAEGKVIAIESELRNFACFQKNIEANRLNNVIAIQKMLWSGRRLMDLILSSNSASHSVYRHAFYGSTSESIEVEAETLDNILGNLGISPVDFIKMDIEGSEIEALKGMPKTLQSRVQLAIAAYHPVDGKSTHEIIMPQLEQLGFNVTLADCIVQARRP